MRELHSSAELRQRYVDHQRHRGLMPSTIRRRADYLRRFDQSINQDVRDAKQEDVERFLDGCRLSPRSRRVYLSDLGSFYRFLMEAGLADHDPTSQIPRPRTRRTLPRPLSDSDLRLALTEADPEMRALLLLGAHAGLRCVEMSRLERDDVLDHREPGQIRVLGKGGGERTVPLGVELAQALRCLPMPRSGYLFTRPRGGPWPPAKLSQHINAYLHGLGIEGTAHCLRHFYASVAYQATRDLRLVQELLGHASPSTTAVYAAYDPRAALAVLKALGERG